MAEEVWKKLFDTIRNQNETQFHEFQSVPILMVSSIPFRTFRDIRRNRSARMSFAIALALSVSIVTLAFAKPVVAGEVEEVARHPLAEAEVVVPRFRTHRSDDGAASGVTGSEALRYGVVTAYSVWRARMNSVRRSCDTSTESVPGVSVMRLASSVISKLRSTVSG